jgi:hypothetical protein
MYIDVGHSPWLYRSPFLNGVRVYLRKGSPETGGKAPVARVVQIGATFLCAEGKVLTDAFLHMDRFTHLAAETRLSA